MVEAAVAGAGAASAAGLFGYNRSNFLYDRKMRQETEYQIMDFRIQQAELWREDVRDIIGLTAVKMDTYLILNTVQLGFCVMAFCEGRLASGTPTWLIGCHTLSLAGAFMYLLMSVWLAMHASVTAKSYEVRLLTQYVRLPVPTWSQLEGARTYASAFEKLNARQMFRVPFISGSQQEVLERTGVSNTPAGAGAGGTAAASSSAAAPPRASDLWGLEAPGDRIYELDGRARVDPNQLRHLRLVREAMQYWQSYDGFSRVAMSMGTNQLVAAMSYYVLGYVLISNHALFAALFAVGLFMAIAAALIRLDMSLTSLEYHISVILVVGGPCLAAVGCQRWTEAVHDGEDPDEVALLMTVVYVLHALWLMFLLYISKVSEQKSGALLPTGFRSVMYIDVFGWIKKQRAQMEANQEQRAADVGADLMAPEDVVNVQGDFLASAPLPPPTMTVPGAGPAVKSVAFDNRRLPVPTRPEAQEGASQPAECQVVREEDFVPTTFVPMEKQALGIGEMHVTHNKQRPGIVPWRIFSMATVVLIVLWWTLGVANCLTAMGYNSFKVKPILEGVDDVELEDVEVKGEVSLVQGSSFESSGKRIKTEWPRVGIRLHGLTCSEGSDGEPLVVASTRFELFVAQLNSTSGSPTRFTRMPGCEAIEGEALQDVAMQCEAACEGSPEACPRSCSALVLHRQGQLLSSCPLRGSRGLIEGSASMSVPWLAESNDVNGQEELVSFATGPANCNGSPCAYAETSTGRIVELQPLQRRSENVSFLHARSQLEPSAKSRPLLEATGRWFPRRVVQEAAAQKTRGGGGLSVFGKGKYLSVLHPGRGFVEVVALQGPGGLGAAPQSARARSAGRWSWRLPHRNHWVAACSAGDSLYVVAEGQSPELWRFPLAHALGRVLPAEARKELSLLETGSHVSHRPGGSEQPRGLDRARKRLRSTRLATD